VATPGRDRSRTRGRGDPRHSASEVTVSDLQRSTLRRPAAIPLAALTLIVLLATPTAPARGQTFVLRDHEDLDFDRPEAWAMAWFAAVAFPTTLAGAQPLPAGAVELSLEGGWVPRLSEEQRSVGFLGDKPEDLNRTAVFGRPRLAVGLPAKVTATVSYAPPVDVDGVEPAVLSLSLARPLWQGDRAAVGARIFAQRGALRGDLTCPAALADVADPTIDPYGCEAASRDELSLELHGIELQAVATLARWPRLSPYATLAWSQLEADFQVDARRNGFLDLTLLETDGTLWSGTLGLSLDTGTPVRLAGEIFYTPLDVVGRAGNGAETDGLLNARLLLAYRLR
jgi:hypothetical protein